MTEHPWLTDLVAFSTAIEEIVLDGCGGESIRVVRLPRETSLLRDALVSPDILAAHIAPAVQSRLEVWNASAKPDWTWSLAPIDRAAVASLLASSMQRLARDVTGVPPTHRAFAAEASVALRALLADAPTFELVSNHWLTCCGSAVYVLELPAEWLLVQLYAFC